MPLARLALRRAYRTAYDRSVETLFDSSWRFWPAAVLMLAGAVVCWRGFMAEVRAYRLPAREPGKALRMMEAFRIGVIGFTVLGLGAAWAFQIGWLAILSLIIFGEEMLESTICVYGLRRGTTLRLRA